MSELIDISVQIDDDLPTWPGSPGFDLHAVQRIEDGAEANVSRLDCGMHTGTHIDAPRHFVQNGASVEKIPLEATVGPAVVVRIPDSVRTITAKTLDEIAPSKNMDRILFKTFNSNLWREHGSIFQTEYTALAPDAAKWLIERGVCCVGIDYLSVQHFNDGPETHQILLNEEVVIIEGLNLTNVSPGPYHLLCMPLKIADAEAAPARAALRTITS